jgi:hypothetical protein
VRKGNIHSFIYTLSLSHTHIHTRTHTLTYRRELISGHLKDDVFENYRKFIRTSKEALAIEGHMVCVCV